MNIVYSVRLLVIKIPNYVVYISVNRYQDTQTDNSIVDGINNK